MRAYLQTSHRLLSHMALFLVGCCMTFSSVAAQVEDRERIEWSISRITWGMTYQSGWPILMLIDPDLETPNGIKRELALPPLLERWKELSFAQVSIDHLGISIQGDTAVVSGSLWVRFKHAEAGEGVLRGPITLLMRRNGGWWSVTRADDLFAAMRAASDGLDTVPEGLNNRWDLNNEK